MIVGAILTQQTSWKNVEKALQNLKSANALTPEGINKCRIDKLEELIKPAGFYRIKAKRLKNFIAFFKKQYHLRMEALFEEEKEKLRRELLKINGIGNETADSILLYALDKPTFVVDNYTKRIMFRIGISDNPKEDYDKIKNQFEDALKDEDEQETIEKYKEMHALIVELGKNYCKKRPLCNECPLNKICQKKGVRNELG